MRMKHAAAFLGAGGVAIALAWSLWSQHADNFPDGQSASAQTAHSTERDLEAAFFAGNEKSVAQVDTAEAKVGRASDGDRGESARPAGADEHTDMRFQVRWGQKGLCGPKDASRIHQRNALLLTFVAAAGADNSVLHEPSVSPRVLKDVQEALDYAVHRLPKGVLEPKAAPVTYIYKNVEQMQNVSCVNRAAIGYFDGAIHIAGDSRYSGMRIQETVVHEYVHYLLLGRGIRSPMWLHEGMAMQYAQEHWCDDPSLGLMAWLAKSHIPFVAMTKAFPYAADEKFAVAAYCQSQMMFEFAFRGVQDRSANDKVAALLEELAQGTVRDSEAFFVAAGLSGEALERAWDSHVEEKQRLIELLRGPSLPRVLER